MTSITTTTSSILYGKNVDKFIELKSASEQELKNMFKWADLSLDPSPTELRGLITWEFARRHSLECSGDPECDYRPDLG